MSKTIRSTLGWGGLWALWGMAAAMAEPAKPPADGPTATPAAKAAPPAKGPAKSPSVIFKDEEILHHVNLAIGWYQLVRAGDQMLSQPSDVFFWNAQCALAAHALPAVFATARGELPLVAAPAVAPKAPNPSTSAATLQRLAARNSQIDLLQSQIAAIDGQIRSAADPKTSAALAARKSALQSELAFLLKLRDALLKFGGLLNAPGDDTGATTLSGQLDSLQQSVTEQLNAGLPPPTPDPAGSKGMNSGGLIARTGALIRLLKYRHGLERMIATTDQLQEQIARAQAPLRAAMKLVIQQGDLSEEDLEKMNPGQLEKAQHSVDSLADKFGKYWNALIPLHQEETWFDQSRHNLQLWLESVDSREVEVARSLTAWLATIGVMCAIVLVISEVWRRMTVHYVTDDRRRRHFLFTRRMVTGTLMVIVIATGFISDIGSFATFAGFLTAGIAVAMQTILVSIAAYFFLLGRNGLKVGDQITAGGVTGEVADIGLVRFYLRELVATGPDLHPTGRVVVFPNSIIFQANPVFKQLAGTAYTWHEATVTLAAGANAAFAREKMLTAVTTAYTEYRPLLELPRAKAEKVSGLKIDLPRPYAHLRARDRELELSIGYPVSFQHVSEIDQLVLKHVSEEIAGDPSFGQALTGHPRIGVAVRG